METILNQKEILLHRDIDADGEMYDVGVDDYAYQAMENGNEMEI